MIESITSAAKASLFTAPLRLVQQVIRADRPPACLSSILRGASAVVCHGRAAAQFERWASSFDSLAMDYYPTTIESNQRRWSDAFAVMLLVIFILLFPITWPLSQLWRIYRLKSRGYYVTREGRDAIEYQELNDGTVRRLTIASEMFVKGPHVVYVPTEAEWKEWMPSWAQGRREEIVENVKRALGNKQYEYVVS